MSSSNQNSQYEDVSIDSVEGLNLFFSNVHDIYRSALDSGPRLLSDTALSDRLESSYSLLRKLIQQFKSNVSEGQLLSQVDVEKLQQAYNRLVAVHEELQQEETVKPTISVVEKKPSTVVEVKEEVEVVQVNEPEATELQTEDRPKKKRKRKKKKRIQVNEQYANEIHAGSEQVKLHETDKTGTISTDDIKERIERVQLEFKKMVRIHADSSIAEAILLDEAQDTYDNVVRLEQAILSGTDIESVLVKLKQSELHMQEIRKALREVADEKPQLARASKKMNIADSDAEIVVPIKTDNAHQTVSHSSFVPASVAAQTRENVVKRNIPKELVSLPRTESIHEQTSLTEKYLTAPRYRAFIEKHFSSLAGFERILDATITKMEAKTIDGIERWLGETHASAFEYIKDLTIAEVQQLVTAGQDVIKPELQKENIKYETLMVWSDALFEMSQALQPPAHVTFGELFARYMLENEMIGVNDIGNSQL